MILYKHTLQGHFSFKFKCKFTTIYLRKLIFIILDAHFKFVFTTLQLKLNQKKKINNTELWHGLLLIFTVRLVFR